MFNPWLELDGVEDRLGRWSELTGLDLIRLGTTAEADEIKDTSVTQPLVVALSLIAAEELRRRFEVPVDTPVAGQSVGELTAAAVAGALSADDAVALAAVRGREMAAACALEPTGMAAVLGGDEQTVLETLERLGLDPANRNGGGQIVAAGKTGALEQLAAEPPEGARVRPLPVAGAVGGDTGGEVRLHRVWLDAGEEARAEAGVLQVAHRLCRDVELREPGIGNEQRP